MIRFVGSLLFLLALTLLTCSGCVRRGQVCIEASHSRPSADWQRNDSIGASVCAEVEPPGAAEE